MLRLGNAIRLTRKEAERLERITGFPVDGVRPLDRLALLLVRPYAPAGELDRLAGLVERVTFHNPENGFCVLRLKNGFTVTGESACASPENFNAEIGRKIARENAVNKVWSHLGFRLRDKLAASKPVMA